jgi:hypothetical protein
MIGCCGSHSGSQTSRPRLHRSKRLPVWSAAADHGLMPTIRPLRTVRCSANNAQLTGLQTMQAGLLPGPVKTAGLHSGFSWSHLWSQSCKFSGVRSGLPVQARPTQPNMSEPPAAQLESA